jgi:hypothetical protein
MAAPVTLVTELGVPYGAAAPFANGGAAAVKATSGNTANASAVATLAADATKFTYITGFDVTGSGATAGLPVVVTVAGLAGGSITYTYTAAIGALVANQPLSIRFPNPMTSSAINTAITVTCAALGIGSTNNVVNAFGFVA